MKRASLPNKITDENHLKQVPQMDHQQIPDRSPIDRGRLGQAGARWSKLSGYLETNYSQIKALNVLLTALLALTVYACAPVFSSLQSAKLVGKDNFETAPHFTSTSFNADNENDHIQNHFGFQLGYGLSDRIDVIARYENIVGTDDNANANVFGIGPKVSLIRDRIAAYIPVGFAFGGDIDGINEFEVQPTVLFTLPVGQFIEINPSAKGIIGDDFYYAFNLGLGFSTNFKKYVIRPEYGMLFNPEESGHYGQFSIGTSIYFTRLFSKRK